MFKRVFASCVTVLVLSVVAVVPARGAQDCVFTLGEAPPDCEDACGGFDTQYVTGNATDGSWFARYQVKCHNSGAVLYCQRTYSCPDMLTWLDPNGNLACTAEYFSTPPNVLYPC